jgi:hypothetical protein
LSISHSVFILEMAFPTQPSGLASRVLPQRDEEAFHLAWTNWDKRAPGQRLNAEKEGYALVFSTEILRAVENGHIRPEHARKAFEVMLLTGHRESDLQRDAKNPRSSATGIFQQTKAFHERSPLNPLSAREIPLTVDQRMDVATAATLFLRQLAHTQRWDEMMIHDASYQVQKFHPKDMHRFKDPDITREVICLGGALFPRQLSMIDNAISSNEDRARLGFPSASPSTCIVS